MRGEFIQQAVALESVWLPVVKLNEPPSVNTY